MNITIPASALFTLEHGQWSEDQGLNPWHVDTLERTIRKNRQDCIDNRTGPNKWQLVFLGTSEECFAELERLKAEIIHDRL